LIALAGLDAETGAIMLLYLDQAWDKFVTHTVLTILGLKLVWYAERTVTSVGDPAFGIVLLSLFGGNR
jgi:hypothetical protein